MADDTLDVLISVRDWLRYGVSRFEASGLVYGHGTQGALDEAAFLILTALDLPVDQLDPWLEARLIRSERERIAELFDKRISTRKPAPYLVNRAYIRGRRFYVDERTIVPRSYIGELLCDHLDSDEPEAGMFGLDPADVGDVLDLCTGGGSLAVLAALAFPGASIDAADVSPDALDVARRNIADYNLSERIMPVQSDLFSGLSDKRYDCIISNPPYVPDSRVDAFPGEYAAEPRLAHAGGDDGLDLVRRIVREAGAHLKPEGVLIVEIGLARQELEASFPDLPFLWLDSAESSGEVFSLRAGDLAGLAKPQPKRSSRKPRA